MRAISYKVQRGFSLVTAIFLLVVLAGLGAVMVTFSTAQHQNLAMDLMGSRAYQAARAGVEWSAYEILKSPAGTFASGCRTLAGASEVIPVNTLAGQLAPFTVNISCATTAQSDVTPATADTTQDIGTVFVYSVSSVANAGTLGQLDYVERRIGVTIAQ